MLKHELQPLEFSLQAAAPFAFLFRLTIFRTAMILLGRNLPGLCSAATLCVAFFFFLFLRPVASSLTPSRGPCPSSKPVKPRIAAGPSRWRRGCGRATLDEFVGQQHFLGEGKLLRRLLKADRLGSVIFYGPPGTGKTTLAQLLATRKPQPVPAAQRRDQRREGAARGARRGPRRLSAGGGRRRCCSSTRSTASTSRSRTCCCPTSKRASSSLVGATTQNPFFAVNSALVSRSRVFRVPAAVASTTSRRCSAGRWPTSERGLGEHDVHHARRRAGVPGRGQRRRRPAGAVGAGGRRAVERRAAARVHAGSWPRNRCSGRRSSTTRTGDAHYDAASALIKSIRGSDPDAGHVLAGPDARRRARTCGSSPGGW